MTWDTLARDFLFELGLFLTIFLAPLLFVGLVGGLLQAATQIRETTFIFGLKFMAISLAAAIFGQPAFLSLIGFSRSVIHSIPVLIHG
jgi:flagellar biosynthesis protein FliQ